MVFCEKTSVFARDGDDASWIGKEYVTFSDMIVSVQQNLWIEWVFQQVPGGSAVQNLSAHMRRVPGFGLLQAAQTGKSRAKLFTDLVATARETKCDDTIALGLIELDGDLQVGLLSQLKDTI